MRQEGLKGKKLLLCRAIGFSTLFAFINVANTTAAIRYVTPQGRSNCSSWTKACSLHTALTWANPGDEIWVKTGVHYPVTTGLTDPRTATFLLKYRVAVYGGFNGTETIRSQRDWKSNPTVLSGDIDQNDNNGDGNNIAEYIVDVHGSNAYHVVTGVNQATLDGFIITAGQANGGNKGDKIGGGMINKGASDSPPDNYIHPIVANCTFIGNWADSGGGGIYNFHSSVDVTDSILTHNESSGSGGGMDNYVSRPSVNNCRFTYNESGNSGGGMQNYYSSPKVDNCTFNGNVTNGSGGGMFNYDSDSMVTACTFDYNSADTGGGMFNMSNVYDPTISKCTFSKNSAGFGAGMANNRSKPTVINCIFTNNKASDSGGGMYNTTDSHSTITNCTFVNNLTPNTTGGNGVYNANHSNPILRNTIMWDTRKETHQINNDSSVPVISYSDIQGCIASGSWNSSCGEDDGHNMTSAPRFVDAACGDLHLKKGSPAIDTGICGARINNGGNITYERIAPYDDIDGDKRPGFGKVSGCDIGADEYKPFSWPMFLPALVHKTSGP